MCPPPWHPLFLDPSPHTDLSSSTAAHHHTRPQHPTAASAFLPNGTLPRVAGPHPSVEPAEASCDDQPIILTLNFCDALTEELFHDDNMEMNDVLAEPRG